MPEYDIIVCQACKLSQIWSHMLQNDPIKIKTNNYKIYDRLPSKVVYHYQLMEVIHERSCNRWFDQILGGGQLAHMHVSACWAVAHVSCINVASMAARRSAPSFFLIKKTGEAIGDLEGRIRPESRFSLRNASSSFCSESASG
jgi:hypothetical protein